MVGPGVSVTNSTVTGMVWGENIGWIYLNHTFGNVINDGSGNLSGYAWGENVGWISFSCLNTGTCGTVDYGVTIDLGTGDFDGWAWGENIGWIHFQNIDIPYKVQTGWVLTSEPDISVTPLTLNFGSVEVGTTVTLFATIANLGDGELTVTGLNITGSLDFSFDPQSPLPNPPWYIDPGGSSDIVLLYTPSALGSASGTLEISSNDPDEGTVQVLLEGTGIEINVPPEEQVAQILDFIDDSVANKTLEGTGPGKSAKRVLKGFINMIELASDHIATGDIDEACDQLQAVYRKCDGESLIPDFVEGDAASDLAQMILDLMADLGCMTP